MNPAARQVALLDAQAEAWRVAPLTEQVLMAGTTGGIPAVARLARVIARVAYGRCGAAGAGHRDGRLGVAGVVSDSHPQAGLRRLLSGLDATRGDVRPWRVQPGSAVPVGRAATLGRALLPGQALDDWTRGGAMPAACR